MRKERRMGSFAAISLRISAAVFAIWLLCMAAITLITAQFVCDGVQDAANDYVNFADTFSLEKVVAMRDELADHAVERQMMNELQYGAFYHPQFPEPSLLRSTLRGSQIKTARAFYTVEGELLLHSGSYFHFYYSEQHHWDGQDDGWAYVDVGKLFANDGAFVDGDWFDKWFYHSIAADSRIGLKMTGHFDGAEFIPSKLEYDADINNGTTMSGRRWIRVYETDEADPADGTIYANYAEKQVYYPGEPVSYRGESYEDICELMLIAPEKKLDYSRYAGAHSEHIRRMGKVLIYGSKTFYDKNGSGGYDHSQPVIYMVSAAVAYPLRMAMSALMFVYLFTFAAAAIAALLLCRSMKKNFTDPVKHVYTGVKDGWGYVATALESRTMWREPYEISLHYRETLDKLRADKNEIARLTAALDYAKEAEEQRQQLSSNIAHELKTPLAVIRSYAEGLQEHIAEDKRDKYLEVIVGETERMDEMVLEMLELSRLEAGRVKLARDVFDLSELTRSVFEKLAPAAAAKELTIEYALRENCLVNVDEARITQVIENFASNALRYTPVGGHIWVRTGFALGRTTLAVENTSPPLADEVLANVWERFYRADESRSEKSSGLGLAIAKSIVELHGGKCSAENTENGVKFSFTI